MRKISQIKTLLLNSCAILSLAGIAYGAPASAAGLATAIDPTMNGPYQVAESEYHLPAGIDPLVDPTVVTELWARIYRPLDGHTAHPLLVFLHGNHATCGHYVSGTLGRVDDNSQYTTTGTCPAGYVVVPNHIGYSYVADKLASLGYVVVSINANRGINAAAGVVGDRGLNLRRGRLVLRHLQQLAQWNRSGGAPASLGFDPTGTIDFSHVGLFGHSRGGEGMLAAYNFYEDPGSTWPSLIGTPIKFQAMFELAPVDGQTARTFVADNIPWTVLLPLCDGDVSDLEGVKVFDRTLSDLGETVPHKKSVYAVWGANHDFFNTQWQTSDSMGCSGEGNTPLFDIAGDASIAQQTASTYAVMSLFRAHVGSWPLAAFGMLLDPAFDLPKPLAAVTNFERSFSDSADLGPSLPLDDFTSAGSSSAGIRDTLGNVTFADQAVPNHDVTQMAGAISWNLDTQASPGTPFYQINIAQKGSGDPILPYLTLGFRVALQCTTSVAAPAYACAAPSPLNGGTPADFSVSLVRPDGSLTPSVHLSSLATVQGPVGGSGDNLHPILQTVRVPLYAFSTLSGSYAGVRFTFDRKRSGAIWLADVRVSTSADVLLPFLPPDTTLPLAASAQIPAPSSAGIATPVAAHTTLVAGGAVPITLAGGAIVAIRTAASAAQGLDKPAASSSEVEIELASQAPIPVRDSLLTLRIDGADLTVSRFGDDGRTDRAIFSMSRSQFDAMPQGAPLTLVDGAEQTSYGSLDKAMLH